jgi:hypothetical protein
MLQAPLGSNPIHHLLASYQVRRKYQQADTSSVHVAGWLLR